MSTSAADAVQVSFTGKPGMSVSFALEGKQEQVALPISEAGDLRGRDLATKALPSSLPVTGVFQAAIGSDGNAALGSIATRSDGTSRIVQTSYWSQGVCVGIYYLFQYWFSLDAKSRVVMDTIYNSVREAAVRNGEVDIQALSHSILTACSENFVI